MGGRSEGKPIYPLRDPPNYGVHPKLFRWNSVCYEPGEH